MKIEILLISVLMFMAGPTASLEAQQRPMAFTRGAAPGSVSGNPAFSPGVESLPLFQQARKASPERYSFAVRKGARFVMTPDRKSFLIVWYPPHSSVAAKPMMIATLHGHGSYAFDEFFLWYEQAAKRGIGIIALQWWFGQGERPNDYFFPNEIYRIFDQFYKSEGLPAGRSLLHGFSRGSANIYGVTAFDRHTRNDLFLVTLANAGKASTDFPINMEIIKGRFGPKPFLGSHWIMYAGGRDPNPDRSGVNGMRETEAWVKNLGGAIALFIEDRTGDHGGFHRNPKNISAALDCFEKLLHS